MWIEFNDCAVLLTELCGFRVGEAEEWNEDKREWIKNGWEVELITKGGNYFTLEQFKEKADAIQYMKGLMNIYGSSIKG